MNRYSLKFSSGCVATIFAAIAMFSTSTKALDWPQWQGPDRNAISKEQGLLKEWPKDGPPLAWKSKGLGGGDSAPSIAKGTIYGMSHRSEDEVVWALSEADGKEIWVTRLAPALKQKMPHGKEGPGCTPTADGDFLYVEGLAGDVACIQAKDGKIVWQKNLLKDFDGRSPMWSYRESPLIDGDKIILTPGGSDAILVALEKSTGKTIWKSLLPTNSPSGAAEGPGSQRGFGGGPGGGAGAAYASPIAIDFGGQRQYVQFTAKALIGVSASDGKFLWRYNKPANGPGINCATPIYHDGFVFASSAYGAGGGVVKLSQDTNSTVKADEVFFSKKLQNHHGGVIFADNCLYGANGGNEGGSLVCMDFSNGNILWETRNLGEGKPAKGSIAMADGRLYYRNESGAIFLIEPSAKEYIEHGRFEQPDRTELPAWSHPVIANGKLYIRDQDTLYCYNIKSGEK